jgi:protein-disulfide isomerase
MILGFNMKRFYQLVMLLCLTCTATANAQVLVLANADAPVTMVVFSAFGCPYCAQARTEIDKIATKYQGQVRVIFKHFPLGQAESDYLPHEAALAAAAQNKFKPMHDALFDAAKAPLSRDVIETIAKQIDLDQKLFKNELDARSWRERINDDLAEANAYKVVATPTFYIDGFRLEGLQTREVLEQIIEHKLTATIARKPNFLKEQLEQSRNLPENFPAVRNNSVSKSELK